jgi:hypothetical protein
MTGSHVTNTPRMSETRALAAASSVHDHELSFGGTVCLIRIAGAPEVARVFIVTADDDGLQPLADEHGVPLAISEQSDRDALGCAMRYLRDCFGEQDFIAPQAAEARRERTVLATPWRAGRRPA